MILQAYGYQHILTFASLEKAQLLLPRNLSMATMIPMSGTSNAITGTKTNYTYLRKALKLIVDEVDEHNPNDIAYVYSGYAPLSVRIVQSILQKQYLTSIIRGTPTISTTNNISQGWRGFEEALKYIRGQKFDIIQKSDDKIVKARGMLSGKEKKILFVVFLGGITFAEVASLRFIAMNEPNKQIIICTTSIISGGKMMDAFIEKDHFGSTTI